MIARLRGVLSERLPGGVVVDVGGVGYLVHVTDVAPLPGVGEEVVLHTSLQVREDSMTLYGFPDADGRRLFELLVSSSGVGPKLALAALATHRPDTLRAAIAAGDTATLTEVSGIGRKVADRLVLELREKVGATVAAVDPPGAPGPDVTGAAGSDAVEGLRSLGYTAAEARRAVSEVTDADADAEQVLRDALRWLASASRQESGR